MQSKTKILFLLFALFSASAFAEPRGWGIGLGVFDEDLGIHARKDFMLGAEQQYEVVLQGGLYNQNKWTTRLNADFHYVLSPNSKFRLYPLAGINMALQSTNNRTGFNIGGGATIELNAASRLFIEAKYVTGDWNGFAFTTGIYF